MEEDESFLIATGTVKKTIIFGKNTYALKKQKITIIQKHVL
jgi:hypothetical protein